MPTVSLKAIITPIPKSSSKDPYVPLNFIGISLLSCVGKGFSGIINVTVVNYFEENGIYEDEENGIRKHRSCEDHIFVLAFIIKNGMSEYREKFCAFIDMQNAFDWIDHDLLFYKLLKYNINGNIYICIKALYNSAITCVKVNKYVTDWFTIGSGVRQGDSLSPTLFGLFINDLIKDVNDLKLGVRIRGELISILAFADDIVIMANTEEETQKMLKCKEKVNTDTNM